MREPATPASLIVIGHVVGEEAVALAAIDRAVATKPPAPITALADTVQVHLGGSKTPLTAAARRKLCRVRNASLTAALGGSGPAAR